MKTGGWIRLIDGNRAKRPQPGYCMAPYHPGFLTASLMRKKRCIEKDCRYLHKNSEAPYWSQEERRKARARDNRQRRKEKVRAWLER